MLIARYLLAWLVAGAAATALILVVVDDGQEPEELPPVYQTELASASRAAGCTLVSTAPPDSGPPAAPARPGVYEHDLAPDQIAEATRHGLVVVQVAEDVDEERLEELRSVQASMPRGTIVAVRARAANAQQVTASAWRRRLACPSSDGKVIEAVRLFQGRYVGAGPDG